MTKYRPLQTPSGAAIKKCLCGSVEYWPIRNANKVVSPIRQGCPALLRLIGQSNDGSPISNCIFKKLESARTFCCSANVCVCVSVFF